MKCIITVTEIQASASLNWEKNMNFKIIRMVDIGFNFQHCSFLSFFTTCRLLAS